jgi:molybdenum cofactor cytidylyltransferase
MAGHAAIVLAAGASHRMGEPKALLAWGDTTLLGYCLRQLRDAGVAHVVVVLGTQHERIRAATAELEGVPVVLNLDEAAGRSGSIRTGASALPDDLESVVIQSVDQPCPADVLRALLAALSRPAVEVVVPTFDGRRGHPIGVAGRVVHELRQVDEASEGLRRVVRAHRVTEVAVKSAAVLWNLNDPAAYARALATVQP